ncbi:hypothetical protein AvCA_20880 [Azotobacter vinelandii CA]|uniref:Uncharacterized protein n=2 Tax=Azotobacter vinelandii TaxID=354 RepID=C1DF86_AZOVD|nr:hypothetical protein Avin_20880 [Azotobacter vinelandii DJ]AGK15066.1 hypothetical protein AvCA_20880 [Azotobacter vinelandii CA]AGK20389.1 hypothetical protein AvCA6_20880 [Azotobacter vinelandii CA6]
MAVVCPVRRFPLFMEDNIVLGLHCIGLWVVRAFSGWKKMPMRVSMRTIINTG